MFHVLVAQKTAGSFHKLAVIKPRIDGSFPVPVKMQGELSSAVTRNAIKHFMAELGAVSVDVQIGTQEFRVTKFN